MLFNKKKQLFLFFVCYLTHSLKLKTFCNSRISGIVNLKGQKTLILKIFKRFNVMNF